VCSAYACDDGVHYPPLKTKEYFISLGENYPIFIGRGIDDLLSYTSAFSYLIHQLKHFPNEEIEEKTVSLSRLKEYFSSSQNVFYYSNAGFERPYISPLPTIPPNSR
jgi:hypothetical protein